jgi:glycosyltransferase involved in cell wall biosynthesis
VLHAQWALLPPFEALLYRRLRRGGVPVVHTVHNVLPHEPSPAARWRWRALYTNADALIVHSRATARRLHRLLDGGGSPDPGLGPGPGRVGVGLGPESALDLASRSADRIHVVPMGPFTPFDGVHPSREAARVALHLPPEAPLALFFGLVRPYKGLDLLLEAWATVRQRSPEARLLVAGPVPGGAAAAAAWRRRIEGLGLGDTVLWHPGYVAEESVSRYLAAADVVALPYRETDDSAVLALARGHGRAVLATDVGGLREALAAGGGRLVAPGEAEALASALQEILDDPVIRERLESEQRAAASSWNWDEAARATIEVYRTVVRGRAR